MWFVLALLPLALAVPLPSKPGPDNEYFDILKPGVKEWRLVFRGQSGIDKSVYDAYVNGVGIPSVVPDACKGVDWKQPCDSHYRNTDALTTQWSNIRDVLFGIVHNGAMVKTIRFDAKNSDYMNWFNESKVLDSCYPDLTKKSHNYFSIEGDAVYSPSVPIQLRRFFINHDYNSCADDLGWFVALDGPMSTRQCDWERDVNTFPVLKYAKDIVLGNYDSKVIFDNADAIVVFVRYLEVPVVEQYFDLMNTGKKEYRLAFRGTAGVSVPIYPAYVDGAGIPATVDPGCTGIDWSAACTSHYRNDDAMADWRDLKEVLVAIVHNGNIVKYIRFNGVATTTYNWFSRYNLLDSCYEDLQVLSPEVFRWFSIVGLDSNDTTPPLRRRFYIDEYSGGCTLDGGWLAVIDNALNPQCAWERHTSSPAILYSLKPRVTNWTNGEVGHADALAIFLKYDKPQDKMMVL